MFAKGGHKIILIAVVVAIILTIITIVFPNVITKILTVCSGAWVLFVALFFRDPDRAIDEDNDLVVSPADGRVVAYDEVEDSFVGNAKVLSIFMSLLDVHVNRMPASGEIVKEEYTPGKFISAYNPVASFENERRRIYIDGGNNRRFSVTQIAGMVARRIVPYLSKGTTAKKGDKIGMIQFGSKVDILMPADVVVKVRLNQRLKAGKTVIGSFK